MANTLVIHQLEEFDDIPAVLRDIAAQVEDGMTSGYYPHWTLL